jgi:AAA15 family ATPase/GTPase
MGENHLTYFKIENFKRFNSFEMENLGQFNLLVGDNNVGKTSVLEGLLFDEDWKKHIFGFVNILLKRKLIDSQNGTKFPSFEDMESANVFETIIHDISQPYYVEYKMFNNTKKSLGINFIEYKNLTEKEIENSVEMHMFGKPNSKYWLRFFQNYKAEDVINGYFEIVMGEFFYRIATVNMIYFSSGYDSDLLLFYYEILNNDKILRKEFEFNLKMIQPKIDEVRTHKIGEFEYLALGLEDKNGLFPLTYFGDGLVKLSRIILQIMAAKGKRLMIDEIETGIHFSRLKDFWKTVIKLCKKYEVQLFATTHSLECQRYFVDAFTELGEEYQNDARNISLVENSEGQVKSVTFDFKQFEFAMEIGYNTRGGY